MSMSESPRCLCCGGSLADPDENRDGWCRTCAGAVLHAVLALRDGPLEVVGGQGGMAEGSRGGGCGTGGGRAAAVSDGRWGMSDLDTFQVLFSLPHHYSYKRNPAGGARLTIDIGRESVKEVERLLDLAEISDGLILAGAWVVVEQGGKTVRKKKKQPDPEWGDDDESDDTG